MPGGIRLTLRGPVCVLPGEKLIAGKAAPAKAGWREFNGTDRRVQGVHRLLRTALRVLGPNRYELLMRYLAHIAVLRNQSVFLNKGLGLKGKSNHG